MLIKVSCESDTHYGRLRKVSTTIDLPFVIRQQPLVLSCYSRGLRQWLYRSSSNPVLQYSPSTSSNVVDTSDVMFTCKVPGLYPIHSEMSIIATPSFTCILIQQKTKCPNSRPSASQHPHSSSDHPLTTPVMSPSHAQTRIHHKIHAPYPLPQSPVLPRHP
jgi:hypothetical protein